MRMPMIDVIFPKGSLDEAAKAKLNATLWETALRWEGIEATEGAASVAWVFLDERPTGRISVGGKPPGQNIYRINVRVMVGFMDQERIDGMVEEIPSGTWGIDGKVWTTVFTAQTLGLDERRVQRMKAVVAERPRLDVKLL